MVKVYFRKPVKQIPVSSGIYFQDENEITEKTKYLLRSVEYDIYKTVCDLKRLSRQVKQIPDDKFRSGVYNSIKVALIKARLAWVYLKRGNIKSAEKYMLRSSVSSKDVRLRFVLESGKGFYATVKKAERSSLLRREVNSQNAKLARRRDVNKTELLKFMKDFEERSALAGNINPLRGWKEAARLEFNVSLKTLNKRLKD